MSVETDVVAATTENADEHAAREQVKAPENTAQVEAAREPLPVKPEQSTLSVAQASAEPGPSSHSNVVSPKTFHQAEQNLAAYLGQKLDPALTKDLTLNLVNQPGNLHQVELKFCLSGPMIEPNYALFSEQVTAALLDHVALKKALHKPSENAELDGKKQVVTPLNTERASDERGVMLHSTVVLDPEQYRALIQQLAHPAPAVVSTKPHADETVVAAETEAVTTVQADAAVAAATPITPETKPAKAENETPVINMDAAKEAPVAKVETPVVNLDTLKENELGRSA